MVGSAFFLPTRPRPLRAPRWEDRLRFAQTPFPPNCLRGYEARTSTVSDENNQARTTHAIATAAGSHRAGDAGVAKAANAKTMAGTRPAASVKVPR